MRRQRHEENVPKFRNFAVHHVEIDFALARLLDQHAGRFEWQGSIDQILLERGDIGRSLGAEVDARNISGQGKAVFFRKHAEHLLAGPVCGGHRDTLAFQTLDLFGHAQLFRPLHQFVTGDHVVDRAVCNVEEGNDALALHRDCQHVLI